MFEFINELIKIPVRLLISFTIIAQQFDAIIGRPHIREHLLARILPSQFGIPGDALPLDQSNVPVDQKLPVYPCSPDEALVYQTNLDDLYGIPNHRTMTTQSKLTNLPETERLISAMTEIRRNIKHKHEFLTEKEDHYGLTGDEEDMHPKGRIILRRRKILSLPINHLQNSMEALNSRSKYATNVENSDVICTDVRP